MDIETLIYQCYHLLRMEKPTFALAELDAQYSFTDLNMLEASKMFLFSLKNVKKLFTNGNAWEQILPLIPENHVLHGTNYFELKVTGKKFTNLGMNINSYWMWKNLQKTFSFLFFLNNVSIVPCRLYYRV